MSGTEYFIWLSELCGAGSPLAKKVYNTFDGNIYKAYGSTLEEFLDMGFDREEAELLSDKNFERSNMIIDYCAENMVGILTYDSEYYPSRLFDTDSPPPVLYYKGRIEKLTERAYITAVGSRKCSQDAYDAGYAVCYKLAAAGISVVTGLADGIDTACITGALDAGGFTVGVLGSGINILYPFDNSSLFSRVFKSGLVITEFSPFTEPLAVNFPIRNRIMAALGNAVLVVEARRNSGALITADHAKMMGRKIYVIPGMLTNPLCQGSNALIKEGATPVVDSYDIINDMEFSYPTEVSVTSKAPQRKLSKKDSYLSRRMRRKARFAEKNRADDVSPHISEQLSQEQENEISCEQKDLSILNDKEKAVFLALCEEASSADTIGIKTSLSQDDVLSALTMLEIYGLATSLPGGMYETL